MTVSISKDFDIAFQDGPKGPAVLYENTFQLEPKDNQKFPTKKAEDVIKVTLLFNVHTLYSCPNDWYHYRSTKMLCYVLTV